MKRKVRFARESSIKKSGKSAYNAILLDSQTTAAIILDSDKIDGMTVTEISRLFPYSESTKMVFLEISPEYDSFEDAFHADFVAVKSTRVNPDFVMGDQS